MKFALGIFVSSALALVLSNCASTRNSGKQQIGTGPFDRSGRYVEAWADNPSKWRSGGSTDASPHELKSDVIPEIAKNEQPPQDSTPLAASASPSRSSSTSRSSTITTPRPTTPKTSSTRTSTRVSASKATKATTKTKAVVKSVPKTTRYTVRKGDSLSAIASRNGCSLSSLKSANRISGTTIRPGQSLTIPKK